MKLSLTSAVAALIVATGVTAAQAEGDAAAGEKVFKKCAACHVVDSDDKKVGPSLHNVIGRTAGTTEGFKYSKSMIEAGEGGLVWSEETIGEYLKDPKGYVKGNKMSFAGLKKDEDVANVIAYLKQFSPAE
ncbi:MAG: cytochrome c family protein [Phyllobacteriaceae bacterium]|nr:cytochrome c family protein [Phyllobacteriaceae bacterium]